MSWNYMESAWTLDTRPSSQNTANCKSRVCFPNLLLNVPNRGSLKGLMNDKSIRISFIQVIGIARDIAKGMVGFFLCSWGWRIVLVAFAYREDLSWVFFYVLSNVPDRDLSARNILVSKGNGKGYGWVCKVADFGLSRSVQGIFFGFM